MSENTNIFQSITDEVNKIVRSCKSEFNRVWSQGTAGPIATNLGRAFIVAGAVATVGGASAVIYDGVPLFAEWASDMDKTSGEIFVKGVFVTLAGVGASTWGKRIAEVPRKPRARHEFTENTP